MALDLSKLKPSKLVAVLNSTALGPVITLRQLNKHREQAGLHIGDGDIVHLLKYAAWLFDQRHAIKKRTKKSDKETEAYQRHSQRMADRMREASAAGRDIGEGFPRVVNQVRRATALADLRVYCETYKPERFFLAWSQDHIEVLAIVQDCILKGGLFSIAMQRGGGKTEIARAAVE